MKYIRDEFGDYFCIAVGGYPEGWSTRDGKSTYDSDIINLKNKMDAGADMVSKIKKDERCSAKCSL